MNEKDQLILLQLIFKGRIVRSGFDEALETLKHPFVKFVGVMAGKLFTFWRISVSKYVSFRP